MFEGHEAVGDCQHYVLLGVTSCSLVHARRSCRYKTSVPIHKTTRRYIL